MIEITGSHGKSELIPYLMNHYTITISAQSLPLFGDNFYIVENPNVKELKKFLEEDIVLSKFSNLVFYSNFNRQKIKEYLEYFETVEKNYNIRCIVMYKRGK